MALYDYKCPKCEEVVSISHPISETPTILCPKCQSECRKSFSAPAVQFRGNGWGHQ
jgi:putative FmdB family regulatory protein